MNICVLKRILDKKKAILWMIICKRLAPPDDHLKEASSSEWTFATTNRAGKIHFWDPSQWDKMCIEYQKSNFNGKNGSKFSHMLLVGAKVADPPAPLPPTVSLTVKYPFFMTSLRVPWYLLHHHPRGYKPQHKRFLVDLLTSLARLARLENCVWSLVISQRSQLN